jgi:hypothetical protein
MGTLWTFLVFNSIMNCLEVRIDQYSFICFTLSRFLETNTRPVLKYDSKLKYFRGNEETKHREHKNSKKNKKKQKNHDENRFIENRSVLVSVSVSRRALVA